MNDVAFSCHNEHVFGSAADDYLIMLWDTRMEQCAGDKAVQVCLWIFVLEHLSLLSCRFYCLCQVVKGHKGEVQCLSFNPFTEHLFASVSL